MGIERSGPGMQPPTGDHYVRHVILGMAVGVAVLLLSLGMRINVAAQNVEVNPIPNPLPEEVRRGGNPAQWRPIWDRIMTVAQHPRCLNCHGEMDAESGRNHPGGSYGSPVTRVTYEDGRVEFLPGQDQRVPDAVDRLVIVGFQRCATCHTARSEPRVDEQGRPLGQGPEGELRRGPWSSRPVPPSWVGMDAKQVCQTWVRETRTRELGDTFPMKIMRHVSFDELIELAFEGRRGGVTDEADPPPMSHAEFRATVAQWLTQAAGACDLNGTITIQETLQGSRQREDPHPTGSLAQSQSEQGTRRLQLEIHEGRVTGTVETSGGQTSRAVITARDNRTTCVTTTTTEQLVRSSGSGPADVQIHIAPDGQYTITATGPAEQGTRTTRSQSESNCVPTQDFSLSEESPGTLPITFTGRIPEAELPNPVWVLRGSTTRTLTVSRSGLMMIPEAWFMVQQFLPQEDLRGADPIVTLTVSWDLRLE